MREENLFRFKLQKNIHNKSKLLVGYCIYSQNAEIPTFSMGESVLPAMVMVCVKDPRPASQYNEAADWTATHQHQRR
jgi:hypothetical protein